MKVSARPQLRWERLLDARPFNHRQHTPNLLWCHTNFNTPSRTHRIGNIVSSTATLERSKAAVMGANNLWVSIQSIHTGEFCFSGGQRKKHSCSLTAIFALLVPTETPKLSTLSFCSRTKNIGKSLAADARGIASTSKPTRVHSCHFWIPRFLFGAGVLDSTCS